jgi:hypothetical protein
MSLSISLGFYTSSSGSRNRKFPEILFDDAPQRSPRCSRSTSPDDEIGRVRLRQAGALPEFGLQRVVHNPASGACDD